MSVPQFTEAETAAIHALEADTAGLACLRRPGGFPDPAFIALIKSAIAKGYRTRLTPKRPMIDPHL